MSTARPPTTAAPPTFEFADTSSKRQLVHVVGKILSVPALGTQEEVRNSPIYRALISAGADNFDEFVALHPDIIESLVAPAQTRVAATATCPELLDANKEVLSIGIRRRIICFQHYFHETSYLAGSRINAGRISRAEFDDWRIDTYNPTENLVPWKVRIKEDMRKKAEKNKAAWERAVKISKSDYPVLKDPSAWIGFHEGFLATASSHNLDHLLDSTHVPESTETHESQQKWMYTVFEYSFKTPNYRRIIKKYKESKDIAALWKEINEYNDHSMTTVLRQLFQPVMELYP